MVQEYFDGKEPLQTINPDEIVAQGTIFANNRKLEIINKDKNIL